VCADVEVEHRSLDSWQRDVVARSILDVEVEVEEVEAKAAVEVVL
jgi:hypothetical protein